MKQKLYCPDIECDSCVRVLERIFKRLDGINHYNIKKDHLVIDYDESKLKLGVIIAAIKEKGYRASEDPYKKPSLKHRMKEFTSDKVKYQLERRFVKYVLGTLILLLLFQGIYAYIRSSYVPNYFSSTYIWLVYLTITVVAIGGAIWHFKAHKTEVTSMAGMMIGMTIGMQTGMMLGPILAVSMGFAGSAAVSMIIGAIVGALTGKCCGVMGFMEGIMAGIMGGVMGAMTGAMLLWHLDWFMPIYMVLNLIVIIGLVYMVFEEVVEDKEYIVKKPMAFWKFFVYCLIVLAILTIAMDISSSMGLGMNLV